MAKDLAYQRSFAARMRELHLAANPHLAPKEIPDPYEVALKQLNMESRGQCLADFTQSET